MKFKILNNNRGIYYIFSFLTLIFYYQSALFAQAEKHIGKKIMQIEFKGNKHTSSDDLFDILQMRPGMILTTEILNNDLKAVFSNGSFSYARIEGSDYNGGVSLLFILEELPLIEDIEFKGMDELSEQEIIEVLPLKEDEVYSEEKASRSMQILLSKYHEKGLFNAAIKIQQSPSEEGNNLINVSFIIDEGEEIVISKINILGTLVFEPEDITDIMELEEDGLIADGTFKENIFEEDKKRIIQFYKENGYLDAEIEEARWDIRWENPDEKEDRVINITIKIKEGEQYFFNGYDLEWDTNFLNRESGKPLIERKEIFYYFEFTNSDAGDIFDNEKYNRDKGSINYQYSQLGYIFTRVNTEKTEILLTEEGLTEVENKPKQIEMQKEGIDYYNVKMLQEIYENEPEKRGKKFIHTKFVIAEGDKGYIENIIIKGNKKTLDKVIRRELLIKEGELFNAVNVQRSREEVYNLGFFKEVNVDARAGSREGMMNLIYEVEEQPTGMISLGGGYGTITGFTINADVSENNLNGTGQKISGKIIFGPNQTALGASWTEPWLFDRPWSFTIGGNYAHSLINANPIDIGGSTEEAYYEEDAFDLGLGIGHEVFLNWVHYHRIGTVYSIASNPTGLVDDTVYLLISQGWQIKNTFTNGISYDNRDNYFNTTTGIRGNISMDVVGNILGGHDHFNRYEISAQYYWWPFDFTLFNLIRQNVLRRWRVVFEHRASAVMTQITSPFYTEQDNAENLFIETRDRLLLGGYESLRGWDYSDEYFPNSWVYGGSHRILFSTEFRIPLEPSLLWFVLFFDGGALYQNPKEFIIDETTSEAKKNAIEEAKFNNKTLSMSYFLYSWGMGIRLQIPIMPIRLYWARKVIWNPKNSWFEYHPEDKEYHFVFGIGDKRF
ncbi:MAG: BamA/TamA family outer membrane protein [Spirochaetia bacterium]|nr:BamA/TamA family outer membrane protein [Spirochaetia bacterium]